MDTNPNMTAISTSNIQKRRELPDIAKSRATALLELIDHLKHPKPEGFAQLFAEAQKILELDDLTISVGLRISRPTVGRWARGDSAPHPLGRPSVLAWLIKEANRKLKQHG